MSTTADATLTAAAELLDRILAGPFPVIFAALASVLMSVTGILASILLIFRTLTSFYG
jgi:hypothetical protein